MKRLFNIFLAALLLFGGYVLIADKAQAFFHIGQYAYNAMYLFFVLPFSVWASGICRKLKPELFGDEE